MSTVTARRNDRFSKSVSNFEFDPRSDGKRYEDFMGHKTAIRSGRSRSPTGGKKKGSKSIISDSKLDELFSKSCGHFMTSPEDLLADDDGDDDQKDEFDLELEDDEDEDYNAPTVASPTSVMADSIPTNSTSTKKPSRAEDIARRQQRQSITLARIPNRGLSRANSCDRGSTQMAPTRGGRRPGGTRGGERKPQRRPEPEKQRSSRMPSGDAFDKPSAARRSTMGHLDKHFSKSYSGGFIFEPSEDGVTDSMIVDPINTSSKSNKSNNTDDDGEGSLDEEEMFSDPDFDASNGSSLEEDEEVAEDAIRRFSKSFAGFEMSPRDLGTKSRKSHRPPVSKEAPPRQRRVVSRHRSADGPIPRPSSRPDRPKRREPTERGVSRSSSGQNMPSSRIRRTKSSGDDHNVINRRKSLAMSNNSSREVRERSPIPQRSPRRGDRRPTRSGEKPRLGRAHTSEGIQRRKTVAADPTNIHRRAVAHMLISDEKNEPKGNDGSL